jgi:methylthioribose-1-phosphate isomerase
MPDLRRALVCSPELRPFRLTATELLLLDQRALPQQELWLRFRADDVVEGVAAAIETLAVRGAPAIGGAAALALACAFRDRSTNDADALVDALNGADARLRRTRPTAVNLFVALDAVAAAVARAASLGSTAIVHAVVDAAEAYVDHDERACAAMGDAGAWLLNDGDLVVTICHTGALATCGQGTALGVVKSAKRAGKDVAVVALETRPLLQGARLTAWECLREGIDVTLVTDSMAAFALARGINGRRIVRAFVGADRIAENGDTANKIGTSQLALSCAAFNVPLHVVAPRSTFDDACADGEAIVVEQRHADEVRAIRGIATAPADVAVWNPSFDVTPARLIASWISEHGEQRR